MSYREKDYKILFEESLKEHARLQEEISKLNSDIVRIRLNKSPTVRPAVFGWGAASAISLGLGSLLLGARILSVLAGELFAFAFMAIIMIIVEVCK